MENFKSFNERLDQGINSEFVNAEINNITESSLGVLKNDLWDNREKISELAYRKDLLEAIRQKLDQTLLNQKYEDIQTAVDLIDEEIEKLKLL